MTAAGLAEILFVPGERKDLMDDEANPAATTVKTTAVQQRKRRTVGMMNEWLLGVL